MNKHEALGVGLGTSQVLHRGVARRALLAPASDPSTHSVAFPQLLVPWNVVVYGGP